MGIFGTLLKDGESIFRDSVALDYDYTPKIMPYREAEQQRIAGCIKPLFAKRSGRNAFVFGKPGIGKTLAVKHILSELEEETEEIIPVYVNCWQKNTTYKVLLEMCDMLGYKFTQNKKTEELFRIVREIVNKKSAVFVFDEVDKSEEMDVLYTIAEGIYRKSLIMITNFKSWLDELDARVKSRLTPELIEFRPYNASETRGILHNRLKYSFQEGVWDDAVFNIVVKKAVELEDIRSGLYIMKEAGNSAEERASRKISEGDVHSAIGKLDDFAIKKSTELDEEAQKVLEIAKANSGKRIGDLFKEYVSRGGTLTYKTFQRKIDRLADGRFITAEKITGGTEGKTTIIHAKPMEKKLSEF